MKKQLFLIITFLQITIQANNINVDLVKSLNKLMSVLDLKESLNTFNDDKLKEIKDAINRFKDDPDSFYFYEEPLDLLQEELINAYNNNDFKLFSFIYDNMMNSSNKGIYLKFIQDPNFFSIFKESFEYNLLKKLIQPIKDNNLNKFKLIYEGIKDYFNDLNNCLYDQDDFYSDYFDDFSINDQFIEDLVKLMKDHESFIKEILEKVLNSDDLERIFYSSIKNNYYDLAELCIKSPKFEIDTGLLINIIFNYSKKPKIVKMLMATGKLKDINYNDFLNKARSEKSKEIIHILKAYDALKTNLDLKKISSIDRKFYDAYQKFIDGNANDLRNLIFPISKKVDAKKGTTSEIYAIFPKENSESVAINIISKSLVKLFKPGYIRSLILTLIETNAQKESAQDLLEQMKLTKEDLKEFFKNNPPFKNQNKNLSHNDNSDFYSDNDDDSDFYNNDDLDFYSHHNNDHNTNFDIYSYLEVQDELDNKDDFYSDIDENDFYNSSDSDSNDNNF